MSLSLGIQGVEKYAVRRGRYYHFGITMPDNQKIPREINILQIKNRHAFPIVANHERFGGLRLRNNLEQGRAVHVLAAPFDQSLSAYFRTYLPPAAAFYDLSSGSASIDELNSVILILARAQTFNMPLMIFGERAKRKQIAEYRFSDFWENISSTAFYRKLWGLRSDWDKKLLVIEQLMNNAWAILLLLGEKDQYTSAHSIYVSMLADLIGEEMGWSPLEREFLKMGGLYHDIGKIGIKDSVLKKPDQLTVEEYAHMMEHPEKGIIPTYLLTRGLEQWNGWARRIENAEGEHHLRYDGKGYPETEKSPDEISIFSWIISMADALDAMTTKRSYTKGNPYLEEKIKDIEFNAGKQFHPEVAGACLRLLKKGISIKTRFPLPAPGNI